MATNVAAPDGLVARGTASGWAQYCFDAEGSVAQRLSSTGAVLSSSAYDAYGAASTVGSGTDPFGYHARDGYYLDRETGFYLCANRYYDPARGRFVTRDPIGYAGGINLYGYCAGGPVGAMDPSGLDFVLDFDNWVDQHLFGGLAKKLGEDDAAWEMGCGSGWQVALDGLELGAAVVGTAAAMASGAGEAGLAGEALEGAEAAGAEASSAAAAEGEGAAAEEASATEAETGEDGCANGQCFAAGTLVAMADGSAKAVEDVKAGDRVESRSERDDERGALTVATVQDAFELHAPSTLLLKFQDGATVEVTAVHPIYAVGRGFTPAGELRVGDRVAEDRDGVTATLVSVVRLGSPKPVYNLTVGGTHTYFVRAGHNDLWVHNGDECDPEYTDHPDTVPNKGEPGKTLRGPRTSRRYNDEGNPGIDRDFNKGGGHKPDEVHEWTKDPNGGFPKRGDGRDPIPGDPPIPWGSPHADPPYRPGGGE